jgi:glycosyltransferase involved in cell wall biosynthesis
MVMRELRRRAMVAASAAFRLLPSDLRQRLAPSLRRAYHRQVAASMPIAAEHIDLGRPWGVGVFGYLTSESGIGEGARGSVLSLQAAGVPVRPINVEVAAFANSDASLTVGAERDNPFAVNLVHLNADHASMLPERIGADNYRDRYTIGFWAWELAEFPDALVPAFGAVHEVWVPSSYVARALGAKTGKPVRVMPHRVVVQRPAAVSRAKFGLPEDAVVFLAAIDFNSFLERKNILGTIAAFRAAFADGGPRVHLAIKAHGGASSFRRPRAQVLEAVGGDPRITVIDRVMSRGEVTELQAAADVFVSLHRAEGFGLPIAECMALGKVVIATDYSGSTDFVDAECAMPVPYRLVEVGETAYPLGGGQRWAEPDLGEAARLMRLAAEDAGLRQRLGAAAAERIARQLNGKVIGARMASRLDEIRAELAAR